MTLVFRLSVLLLAAMCFCGTSALAQGPTVHRATTIFEPRLYDLRVVKLTPSENLVENQQIQIEFDLTVSLVAPGLGNPPPLTGSVCAASNKGTCAQLGDLRPRRYHDVIQTFVPAAGAAVPITVKLITAPTGCPDPANCFGETILAQSEGLSVPVAARYEVAVTAFTVIRPRAKFTDMIKISLRSALKGHVNSNDFCNIPQSNLCVTLAPQGDFSSNQNGTVNNVRVGPFDLIPEVSDDLAFQFDAENLGESYEQGAVVAVLDSMSQAAAGILNAVMANSNFDKLDAFANKIHGLDKCDGPVAVDAFLLPNKSDPSLPMVQTIEARTRGAGQYGPRPNGYLGTDSPLGCGQNSSYVVFWKIFRTSWQP